MTMTLRALSCLLLLACGEVTSKPEKIHQGPGERAGDRDLLEQARGPIATCKKAAERGAAIAEGCHQVIGVADLHAHELLGHSVNADMFGSQLARIADAAERTAASLGNDNPDDDAAPLKDLRGMLTELDKGLERYSAPDGLKLYAPPPGACQTVAELATTALRNLESGTHRLPKVPDILQAHGMAPLAAGLPAHLRTLQANVTIIRARAASDRAWWDAACASDAPETWAPAAAALRAAQDHEAAIVAAYSGAAEEIAAGKADPERLSAVQTAVASWTASEQAARALITPLAPPAK